MKILIIFIALWAGHCSTPANIASVATIEAPRTLEWQRHASNFIMKADSVFFEIQSCQPNTAYECVQFGKAIQSYSRAFGKMAFYAREEGVFDLLNIDMLKERELSMKVFTTTGTLSTLSKFDPCDVSASEEARTTIMLALTELLMNNDTRISILTDL